MAHRSERIHAKVGGPPSASGSDPSLAPTAGGVKRKEPATTITSTSQPTKKSKATKAPASGPSHSQVSVEVPKPLFSVAPPHPHPVTSKSKPSSSVATRAHRSEVELSQSQEELQDKNQDKEDMDVQDQPDQDDQNQEEDQEDQENQEEDDQPQSPPVHQPAISLNSDIEMDDMDSPADPFITGQDDLSRDLLAGSSHTIGGTSHGKSLGNTINTADFDTFPDEPEIIDGYIYMYTPDLPVNSAVFKPGAPNIEPNMKMRYSFEPGMTIHKVIERCHPAFPSNTLASMSFIFQFISFLTQFSVSNPQILVLHKGTWEFYGFFNNLQTYPVRWTMEEDGAAIHVLFVSPFYFDIFL